MPQGKLRLTGTMLQLVYTSLKGKEGAVQNLARVDLSRQLAAAADAALNGLDVEFDFVGGTPKRVRPVGQAYEPQGPAPRAPQQPNRGRPGAGPRPHPQPAARPAAAPRP